LFRAQSRLPSIAHELHRGAFHMPRRFDRAAWLRIGAPPREIDGPNTWPPSWEIRCPRASSSPQSSSSTRALNPSKWRLIHRIERFAQAPREA
jgi:hypothetical protein